MMQELISKAQNGDKAALEEIVRGAQDQIHRLALRMLADIAQAEDATQDILIRIITNLSSFQGDSKFETWVHRIAINHLLTAQKIRARDPGLSFEMFEADLMNGLQDQAPEAVDQVALNELRLKCTMAMLLCLDPDHRAAYVLGDVLELKAAEAAEVLNIEAANYRQRLSRARKKVHGFTAQSCGLASETAPCSCPRRLVTAQQAGRIGQGAQTLQDAPSYQDVANLARRTEQALVALKLQRATGPLKAPRNIAIDVLAILKSPGLAP